MDSIINPLNPTQKRSKKWLALPVALVTLAVGAFAMSRRGATPAAPVENPPVPAPSPAVTAAEAVSHKDGTFTVDANYQSPDGTDGMGVTLTLASNVVTDASLTEKPSNPKSQGYQEAFAAEFKPLVVGKRLDQIQLDRVSGASLTTDAFNRAVAQIADQTKQ